MNLFPKVLLFLVFSFFGSLLLAQNTVVLTGTANDEVLQSPVQAATVYLSSLKDSAVIDYSLTDKDGKFRLEVKKINEPVFFSISDELSGEYRVDFPSLTENKDLGTIELKTLVNLDEAVVAVSAPPIRIKSDTLEFNASSFKVRPDANVETLLKQLPGVDIDEEGTITVNGKEVTQVLVNGKPFFDTDGKIAVENLPAGIIEKVQVSDKKTKKEELAGDRASSNEASLNLTIDEKNNKGYMIKATGGYGTDERYESSLMANYFKGDMRLSLLGSSNNINSIGFSMDDIFGNMGGGRSRSVWVNQNGSFGVNGVSFGTGNAGITQSNMIGLNYSDEWWKDADFTGSYYYQDSDTKNNNYTLRQNLLPDNIFTTESWSTTRNESYNHTFNTEFEVKIDSTSQLVVRPNFTLGKAKSSENFEEYTYNEQGELSQENNGQTNSETDSKSFSNTLNYFKSFRNKNQISLEFSNSNSVTKNTETNTTNTLFYLTEGEDDLRNQNLNSRQTTDQYQVKVEYEINVLDSLRLGVGANYEFNRNVSDRIANDYDDFSEAYSNLNAELTRRTWSDFNNVNPFVAFKLRKNKYSFNLNLGTQILNQKNFGTYMSNDFEIKQDYVLPYLALNGNIDFSRSKGLFYNYNYTISMATANQLLPIEDLSNPVSTIIGNPDLDPSKTHSFFLGFRNFNFQSKSGFFTNFGFNFQETSIVNYTTVDSSFKSTTTYRNLHGNYSLFGGVNIVKSFTSGISKFRVGGGIRVNYSDNDGYIDGEIYNARSLSLMPRVNFNWDLGEFLTLNPSYNLTFQQSNYENYRIEEISNYLHTFKIETTSYWPKNVVFGNDFSYNYNSNIADGFQKDFFLWNISLGYNFWKEQLNFKVKVYDVLGQNNGVSRTISDTYISDVQNDVLTRYAMFSLTLNIDKFGGKDKERRGAGMRNGRPSGPPPRIMF